MYVCMYEICMYVCMHVRMYVCMYRGMYVRRTVREVLQDDSGWTEWNLDILVLVLFPFQDVSHVSRMHLEYIAVPYCSLQ